MDQRSDPLTVSHGVDRHSLEAHRRLWKQKINEVAENTPALYTLGMPRIRFKKIRDGVMAHQRPIFLYGGPMGRSQKNGCKLPTGFLPPLCQQLGNL